MFQEVAIGSFIDGNGTSHTLYRKYYMWGNQNIAQDGFINHAVALSDATILSTNWILYRSDVAGLITAQGPNLYPVFTSGAQICGFILVEFQLNQVLVLWDG